MKISYENALYSTSLSSSIETNLIKLSIKKKIGRLLGKPYKKDPYLLLSEEILWKSSGQTVIDIGANIGTTVFPLAKQFPNARFIAVEPHPLPAARFIQNCQLNALQNVELISAAIAPTADLIKIYTCPTNSGGHRVTGFEGRADVLASSSLNSISIPSLPLHLLFSRCQVEHCDILKVDVEGFEYQVLESLGDLLTPQKIGTIVAEYGPEGMQKAGKSGWELVSLLLQKGYQCKELTTQKKICKAEDTPLLPNYAVTDFVFS
jgi:FkbM family methyltransferase